MLRPPRLLTVVLAIVCAVELWRGGWMSRVTAHDRRLPDACLRGDLVAVRALLAEGVGPDPVWTPADAAQVRAQLLGRFEPGPTTDLLASWVTGGPWPHLIPLFQAVEGDHLDVVEALLAAGADPHVVDESGRSALFAARSAAMARRLVQAGLSLDGRAANGWAPLTAAAVDGDLDRVRALLDVGADPNASHDHGFTVLMSAASAPEHAEAILRLLVARGADPRAISDYGWTALHAGVDVNGEANAEASVRERLGTLRSLGADLEQRDRDGQTPLARAIAVGTGIEVQVLVGLGADATGSAPSGGCTRAACPLRPLLHLAVTSVDAPEKVRALLGAGADPSAVDEEGRTALDRARAFRAELEGRDGGGVGPEIWASMRARTDEVIRVLAAAVSAPPPSR